MRCYLSLSLSLPRPTPNQFYSHTTLDQINWNQKATMWLNIINNWKEIIVIKIEIE